MTGDAERTRVPLLEVDGLGKQFGRDTVLKSGSFAARAGRITALMGRNGAGKSTMLKIAVGRVRPDYGRVLYRGEFLPRPSLARLAKRGLMYSGQGSTLVRTISIREHYRAFIRIFGGGDRLDRIVRTLRLEELLDRRRADVSGGERQRAVLGLALLRAPDCLLFDEPFAGVAPLDVPLVASGLERLRADGTAVVISGHDVDALFEVTDEIIWVTAGTTHWLGSPADAARHHQFRREYLGPRIP